MATPPLLRALGPTGTSSSPVLGRSRRLPGVLAHLTVTKTEKLRDTPATASTLSLVDGVLSLSELCAQLQVSVQTISDLRSQGRGPPGFRVGRELRFRVSEIDAWLTRLEAEDDQSRRSISSVTPQLASGSGLSGPPPDGQLERTIEVLLGTSARIGEVRAVRKCDVDLTVSPATVRICGTSCRRKASRPIASSTTPRLRS